MFFGLLEILLNENGSISVQEAEKVGNDKGMNTDNANAALHKMDRLKWFKIIRPANRGRPYVTFGARSIVEFPSVRTFVRSFTANSDATGSIPAQLPSEKADDEEVQVEDDVEEILPRSSRSRSSLLPSLDPQHMNANDEDHDEDEIQPVQPRRSRRRLNR